MLNSIKHNILNIVTVISVTMFFSCNSNFKEVQKIGILSNEPVGIAENINLKYTDSGKVKANLISPKMLDYTNLDFGYNEFVDGVTLFLFDDDNKKSTVVSDYAIIYDATGLIDMQGNVVLSTPKKDTLYAEQMYYDQKREWLYTNKPVTFRSGLQLINGKGFDSDINFTQAEVLEVDGYMTVDE